MNLLSWRNQREAIQYEKIKLITNSHATTNYQKIFYTNHQRYQQNLNSLSELLNRNNLPVTITLNAKNFTTKENESEGLVLVIKANNRINTSEHTNQLFKEKSISTIKEYHNYCQQFTAALKIQNPPHKQLHQHFPVHQWFTFDVNLRPDNRNNKVNNNTNTQLSCQQHLSTANNNNIMTTTSNIITPWGAPMISTSDATNKYMSSSTPPTTPIWSNAYDTITTEGISDTTLLNSLNNNSNLINSLKNFNTVTNSINNSTSNDTDVNVSEMLRTIEYVGTLLSFYYVPIIVFTGSIGNILSVFVFFNTKLCKLSSSYYLAALAVSDTCFLLGLFAQWLNFIEVEIYNRQYFCQFFTFFSNLACFCSVWFVVAFTVERFIAVMYPLQRQTMCTVRRAKMVLLGLTLAGCLHCIPFLIYSTPVYSPKLETTICDIRSEYKDHITLLNYWDTIIVFVVPFTSIVVCNTFTVFKVWKFATARRTLTMQKLKSQHLPLHGKISSPSSSRETSSAATVAALANTGGAKTATTITQQQEVSTYCITSASLKRQKPTTSCTNLTHANGQHNHIANHHNHDNNNQHQHHHQLHHQHHSQQSQTQHMHSYPSRAAIMKQSAIGNRDYSDIFSRKSKRRKSTNSSQLKVTKMLLIVSTVFVCLNLPSFIMRMITYLETQSSANEKTTVVLQYIFQLLFVTNFGINFVLYCVSGQNFRKAVVSMFHKNSTAQRDGTTQITVSEYYRNSGGIAAACGTNISTRRRMMTQNCWNEMHELQRLK